MSTNEKTAGKIKKIMTTHFLFPQNKIFDHKIKFDKGEGVEGKLYSLYGSLGKYTVCVLIYCKSPWVFRS